ncbi:hypothetical protein Cs7R123_63280 [Catellatospora sp. TT07R-123]|uniref:hypothetical protein n=1 Tax=Catellatospora sp. TT07R-123 TaxID=2733863 RepID=UPI001B0C707F|nr:hypothetical protein [Catellatospora sp. TT07R-123]GHJ48986.1 hypothetical protein Cs7R123_63280 [Catellatospora sp. TT07R-123]
MTTLANPPSPLVQNIAQDDAHVDVQIGVLHNANFYSVGGRPDAERQFRVGVNFLRAGVPRKAEELISEAVMNGYESIEAAYHWMLAILSGQSLEFLNVTHFDKLRSARKIADSSPRSRWSEAIDIVSGLLDCAVNQEIGKDDPAEIDRIVAGLDRLPAERMEEITGNLDMLLSGALQGRVARTEVEHARANRSRGGRQARVPLFFEPVPAAPRLMYREPAPVPRARVFWLLVSTLAWIGVMWALLPLMFQAGAILTVAAATAWIAGSLLYLVSVPRWRSLTLPPVPARTGGRPAELKWKPEVPPNEKRFRYSVSRALLKAFGEYATDSASRVAWLEATKPQRKIIARELGEFYSDIKVNEIYWLVRHHARVVAARWRHEASLMPPKQRPSARLTLCCAASIALLMTATALAAVVNLTGPGYGMLLQLLGLIAAACCVPGTNALLRRRYERSMGLARAHHRLQIEQAAYESWQERLEARPTDIEMGKWLQFDLQLLKDTAMELYSLSHRDVIAHLVLTEPDPGCLRARYVFGPVRYSRYIVTIFLLTKSGVRQWRTTLDFASGRERKQERQSFRYDAIAVARVAELGRRWRTTDPTPDEVPPSRALRVMLVDGNHDAIDIRIEGFGAGLSDAREQDPQQLYELAIDSSGINSALRVLEAVAADGQQWIQRDHERRRLHARRYADGEPEKPQS